MQRRGRARRARCSLDDPQFLLKTLWDYWNPVFGRVLGRSERSMVSLLRDVRDRWAHNEAFTSDDAYRALDAIQMLLQSVAATSQADEVGKSKDELLRLRYEDAARKAARGPTAVGAESGGLTPWREVVTPHADVRSGTFAQAEFAADLAQVHRGEGADEYRDPVEFFRRTFVTEGLRQLLFPGRPAPRQPRWRPGRRPADHLRRRQDPLPARALPPLLRRPTRPLAPRRSGAGESRGRHVAAQRATGRSRRRQAPPRPAFRQGGRHHRPHPLG